MRAMWVEALDSQNGNGNQKKGRQVMPPNS